ncbi:MAG: hypothetical protein Q8S44_01190, partial [Flavobacteriaceae bacterium]|nr:hypothetical protein [Flavobacteriaceae bacterium]
MKHLLIVFSLVGILVLSCNQPSAKNNQEKNIEKLKQDSIAEFNAKQTRIEKAKQDSVVTIEQGKVIGDIVFFMPEKEVKSKIEIFRKKNKRPDKFLGKPYYDEYIGEYKYIQMLDLYYKGKLYELHIYGNSTIWENYDSDVPKQIKNITDVVKQKYGEPDFHNELEPRYSLNNGQSYLINRWEIGKKTIEVRVEDNGGFYNVNVSIFLPEIREKIKEEKLEKEKESTEK